MKKLTLTTLLFSLLSLCALAQVKPQNYISISYGPSLPMGEYANANNIGSSGYATPGNMLILDWGKYYSNFGITATMSFGSHNLNHTALNEEFAKYGQTPVYTDSSHWMSSCLMFGPSYALRFNRITVDFRLMGGLYFAKAPDVRLQSDEAVPPSCAKFNNNQYNCVGGWGYQGSCTFRYNFCKHFYGCAKASFTHSRPDYQIPYLKPGEAGKTATDTYSFSQRTSVLDLAIGVGYGFGL